MILVPRKRILTPRSAQRGFFTLPGGMGIVGPGGGGGGGGDFPQVEAVSTGEEASGTSHVITLPSGITAGDLLLIVLAYDGTPTVSIASGSGWTILGQQNASGAGSAIVYKVAAGGDTLSIGTSASEAVAWIAYRISGAAGVSGSSANNNDPPEHTPPGGAQNYLWIASQQEDGILASSAPPTNYSDLHQESNNVGSTARVSISTAQRELNAASENPGAFVGAGAGSTWTLAVAPT